MSHLHRIFFPVSFMLVLEFHAGCKCGDGNGEKDIFQEVVSYECLSNNDCDDDKFCNGEEWCDAERKCRSGKPVDCSYLYTGCSMGICDESKKGCVLEPQGACWQRCYGGEKDEMAYSVRQTLDGGYIVAGYKQTKESTGNYKDFPDLLDGWVIKLFPNGDIEWDRILGGEKEERFKDIELTDDGGYILCGVTASKGAGGTDIWVVKLDKDGNVQWDRTVGGTYNELFDCKIIMSSGKGYTVAFETDYSDEIHRDIRVSRLDDKGDLVWEKSYIKDSYNNIGGIQQTIDGGFIVAVSTSSSSVIYDSKRCAFYWIFKLTDKGEMLWDIVYDFDGINIPMDIKTTVDGGFVVLGFYKLPYNDPPIINTSCGVNPFTRLTKFNSQGDILWDKIYSKQVTGTGVSIDRTNDGGYVIAGSNYGIAISKLDKTGSLVWNKVHGGNTGIDETARSIRQTSDGGYIIAGTYKYPKDKKNDSNFLVMKLNSNGDICQ